MKAFLDRIFKLPPVEERIDIQRSWQKCLTLYSAAREQDDAYIYYLLAWTVLRVGCVIGFFVVLAYCSVHVQSFLGWSFITDDKHTKMMVFLEKYNGIYEQWVFFIMLPFYFVKFRWNINPKKYDVLSFDSRFGTKFPKKWWVVIHRMFLSILIALFIMTFGYWLPGGPILELLNWDTVASLVFYMGIIVFLMSAGSVIFLRSIFAMWRYIGPYEENVFN